MRQLSHRHDYRASAQLALLGSALCAMTLFTLGCGTQTYEARLRETSEFFAYQNELNQSLSKGLWGEAFGGPAPAVQMRIPKPFQMKPRPQPIPSENKDEPPTFPPDTRHPFFLGIQELPGLIDAWEGVVPIGGNQGMPAYLYAVSNHQRFINKQLNDGIGPEPGEFLTDLEITLTSALNIVVEEGQGGRTDNVRYKDTIPREEKYALRKDFISIALLTPENMRAQLGGMDWRVQMYEYTAGQIQVAILMVYPVRATDKPDDRLKLAMETFKAGDQAPRAARPGQAASGGGANVQF